MTLDELTRLLNQQTQTGFTGQATPISYDQIIQAIQGQYQPAEQFQINQPVGSFGAERFINQPVSESVPFIEYGRQQQAPTFTPSAFDIEQYRYKNPVTVNDVVDSIGGDGGSGSTQSGGLSVDDAGLATASNVTPGMVQALGFAASMLGLPGGLLGLGKNAIADALTQAGYNSAVAQNVATVATQMGLDPSDPANSAAISAGIQSLSQAPTGTTAATPGTAGTGGTASAAAQAAASAGVAMGLSNDAIAALSQTAANNAISGMTAEQAVNSAISGTVGTVTGPDNVDIGGGWSPSSNTTQTTESTTVGAVTGPDNVDVGGGWSPAGGESSSGGGKIICTAMNHAYGFGSFRNAIWITYSDKHLTKAHEVGYHTLFLPLVDFGFKRGDGRLNLVVRKSLEWVARHRSIDLRAEMRGTKRDQIGRVIRFIFEPLCYAVGKIKGY